MAQQEEQQRGFSLIELMVVLGVAAIALGLGVPAFTTMLANEQMSSAANELVYSLHAARGEAIKRRRTVTVCPASDGEGACIDGGNLAGGWVVFVDDNDDGVLDPGEVILQKHGALPAIFTTGLTAFPADAPGYIAFAASGNRGTTRLTTPLSDIQLCDSRGDVETGGGIAAGRWIQVTPTGRPTMRRSRAELQGPLNPLGGCA